MMRKIIDRVAVIGAGIRYLNNIPWWPVAARRDL